MHQRKYGFGEHRPPLLPDSAFSCNQARKVLFQSQVARHSDTGALKEPCLQGLQLGMGSRSFDSGDASRR